jgi:hypothetical protein
MPELLGVAVELKLHQPICVLDDFRKSIQSMFKVARDTIPGCLYAPTQGCVDAKEPTVLFHVSVFADEASFGTFMGGSHASAKATHAQHVASHRYAMFAVSGELALKVQQGTIGDSEVAQLNALGHSAFETV